MNMATVKAAIPAMPVISACLLGTGGCLVAAKGDHLATGVCPPRDTSSLSATEHSTARCFFQNAAFLNAQNRKFWTVSNGVTWSTVKHLMRSHSFCNRATISDSL